MRKSWFVYLSSMLFMAAMLLSGCAKKPNAAKVVPPPPPQPSAPTVTLTADPQSVEKGQAVELSWHTQDATQIVLDGVGPVSSEGTRRLIPGESTTYTLRASGPGGSKEATAQVTVTVPPVSSQAPVDLNDMLARNVKDIFFGYDEYKLDSMQSDVVTSDAKFLADHPELKIVIEGHCDERGSDEYNLALGDSRAQAVKSELVKLGVKPDQIKLISYGKEKPFCSDENEECWRQNRRAHFALER